MKKTVVSLLLLSSALTGCLSTPYETPPVNTPDAFAHAAQTGAYTAPDKWWETFNDARLNRLIETALTKNNDLAAAALRVQKAQLQVRGARLDQWPQASGSVSARKSLNDSGSSFVGDDGTVQSSGDDVSYSASFSLAYELDLWGRLKATTDAARFEATATEADLEAARLALIGTTAQAYWQIAYTHQQIRDAELSLDYARRVRDMVRVQHQAGSVSGIEVSEADQTVNAQEASLSALRQQLVENRTALTLLLNGEKWPEADEATELPAYDFPAIAPGLPAELLARRPDLKAAETRLRGTLRSVDATRASMYPALSLTGSTGGSSTELGNVLSDPSSALGVGLSLPFLNFAQNDITVKSARKDYEIAVVEFRQTLLDSFADVDNALSAHTRLAEQGGKLDASLSAAERSEQLYALRYRTGAVALRVWLDAQEEARSARLSRDNNRLSRLINQATVYQALGGSASQ